MCWDTRVTIQMSSDSGPSFFLDWNSNRWQTIYISYAWRTWLLGSNSSSEWWYYNVHFCETVLIITILNNSSYSNVIVSCESFKRNLYTTTPVQYLPATVVYSSIYVCIALVHNLTTLKFYKNKTTHTQTHFIIHILIVKY